MSIFSYIQTFELILVLLKNIVFIKKILIMSLLIFFAIIKNIENKINFFWMVVNFLRIFFNNKKSWISLNISKTIMIFKISFSIIQIIVNFYKNIIIKDTNIVE